MPTRKEKTPDLNLELVPLNSEFPSVFFFKWMYSMSSKESIVYLDG